METQSGRRLWVAEMHQHQGNASGAIHLQVGRQASLTVSREGVAGEATDEAVWPEKARLPAEVALVVLILLSMFNMTPGSLAIAGGSSDVGE